MAISKLKRERILIKNYGVCFYCKSKIKSEFVSIEHFIPKAMGGSDEESNLTICCQKLNQILGCEHPLSKAFFLRDIPEQFHCEYAEAARR